MMTLPKDSGVLHLVDDPLIIPHEGANELSVSMEAMSQAPNAPLKILRTQMMR